MATTNECRVLTLTGISFESSAGMEVAQEQTRGKERGMAYRASHCIVATGSLDSPVGNRATAELRVYAITLPPSAAHIEGVGGIYPAGRGKLGGFVYLPNAEFQALWAMALANRVSFCSLRFDKPERGSAPVRHVAFYSDGDPANLLPSQ